MTLPRVLVVYATTHGHTRRIAQRIADVLMRLIAHRRHQPTDVSRDVGYTDWPAVERFANAFADDLASARHSEA